MSNALENRNGGRLADLGIGQHAICLHDGDEEKLRLVAELLEQAVGRRLKIVCVLDEADQGDLLRRIDRKNIAARQLVQRGQLAFLFPGVSPHGNGGGADLRTMGAFFETAAYRAQAQGFSGLCVLAVMDAFMPPSGDGQGLVAFEAMHSRAFYAKSSLMVSFYARKTARSALLLDLVKTHDWIIMGSPAAGEPFVMPAAPVVNASRTEAEFAHAVETLTATHNGHEPPAAPPPAGAAHAGQPSAPAVHVPATRAAAPTPSPAVPLSRDRTLRLLETVNTGHARLAREDGEQPLLDALCRLLVESGGYRMAWAGRVEQGVGRRVRPVAQQGMPSDHFRALDIGWGDADSGGPAGAAIRSGRPAAVRLLGAFGAETAWREQAERLGYGAVAAFPLAAGGSVLGVVTVYAAESDAFDAAELGALAPLAEHAGSRIGELRARAEAARLARQSLLPEALLNAPPAVPMACLTPQGRLVYANRAFLALWSCEMEDALPARDLDGLTARPEEAADLLRQALESGRASGPFTARLPGGAEQAARFEAAVQRDEMGAPVRVTVFLAPENGGEQGKRAAAEAAEQARSDFLAGVSHELLTPLNAVIGFSEVLLEPSSGALNPRQAEYVNHILENGTRLQGLIEDVLTISREEPGGTAFAPAPVALHPLLAECVGRFGAAHGSPGGAPALVVEEASRELVIHADAVRLRQALCHLLENAVKFTPADGSVLLSMRALPSAEAAASAPGFPAPYQPPRLLDCRPALVFPCVEIVVSDTGIGVDPDQHKAVFEPFFQVRISAARKPAGIGMGLALARRHIALHGGRIWVESEGRGKGSRFVCVMPLDNPEKRN